MSVCFIRQFRLNSVSVSGEKTDLCQNPSHMQYYKGNALREKQQTEPLQTVVRVSFPEKAFRLLVFPGMLIFWILQRVIHKSVEHPD